MERKIKLLITGGAGFIGSNLVDFLIDDERIELVRVLDNLSTGDFLNIEKFINHPKFQFVKGDICDYQTCLKACKGIDKISHHAALGSVPRSIEDPIKTTETNILGTINVLFAAVQENVERVILALSSSSYGNLPEIPKVENRIGDPLSPYAVSKLSTEQYAKVFGELYNLKWIGLRYFNVFGPNQNHSSPYSAVIPSFCKAILNKTPITIYGDGFSSRDFTYVNNVLIINKLSLFTESKKALNEIYNCACGEQTTLIDIAKTLSIVANEHTKIIFKGERPGDIKHSLADITKAKELLEYEPVIRVKEGLSKTFNHYKRLSNGK